VRSHVDAAAVPGPLEAPQLFREIIPRRVLAFGLDGVILTVLAIPVFGVMNILGILTFGLALLLLPIALICLAAAYYALTLGGPWSATGGMRYLGLLMRDASGGDVSRRRALIHAGLFWTGATVLAPALPLLWLVPAFSPRRRMGHDMIVGLVLVDADAWAALKAAPAGA